MKKFMLFILLFSLFFHLNPPISAQSIPQDQDKESKPEISLIAKIQESKKLLEPVTLRHSDKISGKDLEWKEVGLAVMDINGKITIIKIKKDKQFIQSLTPGFMVNFEPQPSKITWNGKNIALVIKSSPQWETLVVICTKWLEVEVKKVPFMVGKKRHWTTSFTVDPVLYPPYSTGLHQQELIEAGHDYFDLQNKTAYNNLDRKAVKSLVNISKNVTEGIPQQWVKNLFLIEHTDPKAYRAFRDGDWKYSPYERALIRLGLNGKDEFKSKNFAGAVGLMQFTNNTKKRRKKVLLGTWDIVRVKFPSAQLPSFREGSTDHVYSIMAAVLLHDLNALELVEKFGIAIMQDPQLEYYLAAAYNTGIGRVINGIRKYGSDWDRALLSETRIYIEELEYLHQHPLNPAS